MVDHSVLSQKEAANSSTNDSYYVSKNDASKSDDKNSGVNPYIPKFISKAPWYLNSSEDLKHQRATEQVKTQLDTQIKRGIIPQVAIKYRKNACENCGAMTHDAKNCVERPRKKGAKYTSANICPDEYILTNEQGGYDAVRDRWAGFDPESHRLLVETHLEAEAEQERRRAKNLAEDLIRNTECSDIRNQSSDNKEYQTNDQEVTFDTKDDNTRTTTRNLRIRDDTAKYLINLDVDSAYYDPKSRSLREDPLLGMADTGLHTFRGDNEIFKSGEARKPKELEMFAWEAKNRGVEVNFMAQPTELEFMFKEQRELVEKEKKEKRKALIERFGGSEFLRGEEAAEKGTDSSKNEGSSPKPGAIKMREILPSMCEADIYTYGHNAVWGSYYDPADKLWGYKCCKSTAKDSKCTLN